MSLRIEVLEEQDTVASVGQEGSVSGDGRGQWKVAKSESRSCSVTTLTSPLPLVTTELESTHVSQNSTGWVCLQ